MLIKNFVFSLTYHLIYMQPLTDKVTKRASRLDTKLITFTLGVKINRQKQRRAPHLSRLLPLRARRRKQLVKTVIKFYTIAHHTDATDLQLKNWNFMSSYSMISPFLRSTGTPDNENITVWKNRAGTQIGRHIAQYRLIYTPNTDRP